MKSSLQVTLASLSACDKPEVIANDNFRMFNHAVRKLAASLRVAEDLGDVDVAWRDFHTNDPPGIAEQLIELKPDVLGLSVYVWSLPTLVEVAALVKRALPDCWIILGGPSSRAVVLNLSPYDPYRECIDALVAGEGEQIMRDIVRARMHGRPIESVRGLSLKKQGVWQEAAKIGLEDLEQYGSAYRDLPEQGSNFAYIETYRGCPMSCAFCQWGSDSVGARRIYSTEFLIEEFEAIKKFKPTDAFLVDAALNLNPRAFRNLAKAEAEVGLLKDMSLALEFYPLEVRDEYLEFLQGLGRALIGIGIQSIDLGLLHSLQRPFKIQNLRSVIEKLTSFGEVYLEIILGLPGDTAESFRRTLEAVREFPCYIRVYRCRALPDAFLSNPPPGVTMDFDPVSLELRSCTGWSPDDFKRETEHVSSLAFEIGSEFDLGDSWWVLAPQDERYRHNRYASEEGTAQEFAKQQDAREVLEIHDPPPGEGGPAEPESGGDDGPLELPAELLSELQHCLTTTAGWGLEGVEPRGAEFVFTATTPSGALRLLVQSASTKDRVYGRHGPVALTYLDSDSQISQGHLKSLDQLLRSEAVRLDRLRTAFEPFGPQPTAVE